MKPLLLFILLLFVVPLEGCVSKSTNYTQARPAVKSVGCLSGDCENGYGTSTLPGGSKYVGQFQNSIYNGKGTITFNDGSKIVGQWENGKINGKGTMFLANGEKIERLFKHGEIIGQSILTRPDGKKYTVIYDKGKEISRTEITQEAKPVVAASKPTEQSRYKSRPQTYQVAEEKQQTSRYKTNQVAKQPQPSQSQTYQVEEQQRPTPTQEKPNLNNTDFGNYYALVIGNNNYRHIAKLKTARNDARAVAQLLRNEYAFNVTHIQDATRKQMLDSLTKFRHTLTEKDNLLIYYAGHGYLDKGNQRGYWLPVDAEQNSKSDWISTYDIIDTLKAMRAKHILVVADSCFSGTLTRDARSIMRIQEKIKTDDSYWSKMSQAKSRVVLTSGGLEPVEDGAGDHSVFNKYFRKALLENSSIIDSASLYPRIKRLVMMNAHQSPEYGDIRFTGSDGGDFLFVRK